MKTPTPPSHNNVRKRSPWPFAIAIWFALFISGLAAWAVVAFRQNQDLVRPDYYEEEIAYQKQIDRLNRTAAVRSNVAIVPDSTRHELLLRLPETQPAKAISGQVEFYRPSDAQLDFAQPLKLDARFTQHIDTSRVRPGLWKVRIRWKAGDEEFYFDQAVVL